MISRTGQTEHNSGGVFMAGEGQATMEIVGRQGDLQPSAMRRDKQASNILRESLHYLVHQKLVEVYAF